MDLSLLDIAGNSRTDFLLEQFETNSKLIVNSYEGISYDYLFLQRGVKFLMKKKFLDKQISVLLMFSVGHLSPTKNDASKD